MVVGIFLLVLYGLMIFKADRAKEIAKGLSRNHQLGTYVMGFGMVWFWLLVAPAGKGIFSSIAMDLGEFNRVKPILMLLVPAFCVGMIVLVKEFLFVRAAGLFLLMAAAPLLYSSDFEPAAFQFVMPLFCYVIIIKGLYMVGMPYLFRDAMDWVLRGDGRWKMVSFAGVGVGVLFVVLSLTAWRGY